MRIDLLLILCACIAVVTFEQAFYRLAARSSARRITCFAAAVLLHICGLVLWYFLLRVLPLGVAMPLMGAQYATVAMAGKWFFGEPVDARRWIGIAIIMLGFCLIAVNER